MATWQDDYGDMKSSFFDVFVKAAEECVVALQPEASTIEHIEIIFLVI